MKHSRAMSAGLAMLLTVPTLGGALLATTASGPHNWHDVKCARYKRAWAHALARQGNNGLSRDFLDRHDAFLTSDCRTSADVCPRSSEEFRLANVMVILAMNAGTASTFPPFGCAK